MARLSTGAIITVGSKLGGNDAVGVWVAQKLSAWLRKHYNAWAWPFLIKQATGIILPAGVASLDVGGGNAGLASQISRIFSPIYFRSNGFGTRSKAPVRQLVGGPASAEPGNVDPASNIGMPQAFTVNPEQDNSGNQYQTLGIYPYTDVQYFLSFTYQRLPDDLGLSDIPLYPNEMTLIQVCKCAAIEYDNSNTPWFKSEEEILAGMVTADRDAYGGNASFGDQLQLDDGTFPTESLPAQLNKMGW